MIEVDDRASGAPVTPEDARPAEATATGGGKPRRQLPAVFLALAALCLLVPTGALAQGGIPMGPGMMGRPPDREAVERTPETAVSARMLTFIVLVSLAVGAGGLAAYRVARARGQRHRGGPAFVTEAVLVVDLVRSTHLATHYGDGLAMRARTALKDRALTIAQGHGLVFAENTGDGYFMTFESVAGAIRTAFALLVELRDHPPDLGPAPPLEVRIGITYGEILLDARGARHGAVINKAFRIEGLSRDAFVQIEGQGETAAIPERDRVFLGEDAAEEARARGFSLVPVGICTLKGFSGLHRVYQAVP